MESYSKSVHETPITPQEDGALFGDGIESDALDFGWGATATFRVSDRTLNLVARSKKKSAKRSE